VSLFPEAIVVNDNLIDLTARGGSAAGESISIAVWPATSYVTFVCEAITGGSELALTLSHDDIDESSEKQRVRISGTLPVGISSHCPVVVRSPRAFARTVFVEMLAECGISLEGALLGPSLYTDGAAALAPDVLAEHLSPPFSEAAKVILKVSQNLHAELCPRIIGATVDGVRGADAAEAGYGHIRRFLSEQGLAADGIVQGDASGAEGYFTPHFMCRLLLAIAHHPIGSALRFGLPVLGRDGTLSSIIPDSAAAGHVVAKTGTIAITDRVHKRIFVGAKGLAGYIHAASGRHIAFTVYVNNVVLEPGESYDLVGEMLGNIAAAAYETM
jgi:D-alanyl-D-alanine carboxypeptidase/D-alanyl-D-alanine-endopeptidase (penicillin-binding protein 4)